MTIDKYKRHTIAKISYFLTWHLWLIFFKFFVHYRVLWENPSAKSSEDGPVLIMANHIAWFDPFLVSTAVPLRSSIQPVQWLTKEKIFKHPIMGPVVWLYGSLNVKKGLGIEKTLAEAVDVLKEDGTVGIFPEGKVRKHGKPRNGRRGVAYLVKETNPLIIPVYIDGAFKITFKELLLRRRHITVRVKTPFRIPEEARKKEGNLEELANYLAESIRYK